MRILNSHYDVCSKSAILSSVGKSRKEVRFMPSKTPDENQVARLSVVADGVIEASNSWEVLKFDLTTGKFSLYLKGRKSVHVRGAFARLILRDGDRIQTIDKWAERTWEKVESANSRRRGKEASFTVICKGSANKKLGDSMLKLSVEVFADTPIVLLRLELENGSGKPLNIREFQPLVIQSETGGSWDLGSGIKNWRLLKNGYQTSSPCYSLTLTELDKTCSVELFRTNYNPRSKYNAVNGEFDSEWMTAFRDNTTGNSAVIGFVTMKDNMSQIDFKVDEKETKIIGLQARSVSDNILCDNDKSIQSEKLLLDLQGPLSDGLDRYADWVASEMDAIPWKKVLTGWCSWYEFFEKISEELILNVIDYYRKNRDRYPIDYIQVDDGYFNHRGDWTIPSDLFPHGMKFIADKIKEAGFKPGIWLSPFQISGGSKIFQQHPDWTIRDEKGNPIGHEFDSSLKYSYYGLDCTNPAVIDWVKSLFRTITKEWGYEYVKIDFLFAATFDGLRHDKNATRAQALRRGLEAIREAVGAKVPVLGCLAPLGQAIGLVNSYRVSPDTATRWKAPWPYECGPAMRDTMRNTILRYFMHNRFWANDPDCVIARRGKDRSEFSKAAEIEYLSKGGTISEDEVKFEMTVLALLGGPLIYSDDPIHLSPERERYLPLILPPCQGKARIIDLLESALPRILNLKFHEDYDSWDLVGLLNWDDSPEDAQVDFSRLGLKKGEYYHVYSFWDEKYLGKIKDVVTVEKIPAHSASLLSIRKVQNRPQLVSSTMHTTQGAAEVENVTWKDKEKTLEIKLRHPGTRSGKLIVHFPSPFKFNSVLTKDAKANINRTSIDGPILTIDLTFKQSAVVIVGFN